MIHIDGLPIEIIYLIHEHVARAYFQAYKGSEIYSHFSISVVLELSHVCGMWRRAARSNPLLWSDILLITKMVVYLCISLSKEYPLHIFLPDAKGSSHSLDMPTILDFIRQDRT